MTPFRFPLLSFPLLLSLSLSLSIRLRALRQGHQVFLASECENSLGDGHGDSTRFLGDLRSPGFVFERCRGRWRNFVVFFLFVRVSLDYLSTSPHPSLFFFFDIVYRSAVMSTRCRGCSVEAWKVLFFFFSPLGFLLRILYNCFTGPGKMGRGARSRRESDIFVSYTLSTVRDPPNRSLLATMVQCLYILFFFLFARVIFAKHFSCL